MVAEPLFGLHRPVHPHTGRGPSLTQGCSQSRSTWLWQSSCRGPLCFCFETCSDGQPARTCPSHRPGGKEDSPQAEWEGLLGRSRASPWLAGQCTRALHRNRRELREAGESLCSQAAAKSGHQCHSSIPRGDNGQPRGRGSAPLWGQGTCTLQKGRKFQWLWGPGFKRPVWLTTLGCLGK